MTIKNPAGEPQRGPTEPEAAGEPVITMDLLRDRWAGIFGSDDGTNTGEHVGEAEGRYLALSEVLEDSIQRLCRRTTHSGEDVPFHSGLIDEVFDLIRETIITRVYDYGLAR